MDEKSQDNLLHSAQNLYIMLWFCPKGPSYIKHLTQTDNPVHSLLKLIFLYIAWCLKNAPKKLVICNIYIFYTDRVHTCIPLNITHYNYYYLQYTKLCKFNVNKRSGGISVKAMVLFTKLAEQCGSLSDPIVLWLWGGELDRHHKVCRVTCAHERWRNGLKNIAQV